MVNQMIPFSEMKIGKIFRWVESHGHWPIQDIDSTPDGYFVTLKNIYPNDEFMLLEKKEFDYRFAIRVIFLGEETIGWIVCGNALYPAIQIQTGLFSSI